jgi:hypothetical protein
VTIYVGSESYSFHLGHCLQSKIRLLSPNYVQFDDQEFSLLDQKRGKSYLIARAFFPGKPSAYRFRASRSTVVPKKRQIVPALMDRAVCKSY